MSRTGALLAVTVLMAAGCGGDNQPASKSDGTAKPAQANKSDGTAKPAIVPGPLPPKTCSFLTAGDVTRVAATTPKRISVARSPTERLRCASVFIDGSGGLLVEITETDGGGATLSGLRRSTRQQGRAPIRPLAGLGPGAWVARRTLAFAKGERVVKLATGYDRQGRLTLTAGQLVRLARTVASRV